MSNVDDKVSRVNSEVTGAIVHAEQVTIEAIEAWQRVELAELTLAQQMEGLERDLAQRGVAYARTKVAILQTILYGRFEKCERISSAG